MITAVLGAGCVSAPVNPTAEEIAAADYGAPPTHYSEAVQKFFYTELKDPSSVQYGELTEPEKGWFSNKTAPITGGRTTHVYGWLVKASINAKNSYGGYVGFRTYSFLFRGEQLIDVLRPVD